MSAQKVAVSVSDLSTFYGNISNTGTIAGNIGIVIGTVSTFSGAIVNSGVIIGAGGTAIDVSAAGSAVIIDQNGGSITGNILLSPNADVLNLTGGTIAGNIVGQSAGTLNFNLGNGTTYADNNAFTNLSAVNIETGTVLLNGTDSAATLSVSAGATLAGTGTLDPATTISGTLEPGTPGGFGTMTINGSLLFEPGSTYAIDIAPSNNSKVALTGAATLAGNVVVTPQLGTYTAGTQYQILTTTGGLGGTTFAGLTINGRFTGAMTVNDVGNNVDVDITTSGFSLLSPPPGLNQNQQNVLNGINNAILQGDTIPPGFVDLGGLSGPALGNALTELEGQPASGAQTSSFQLMTDFLNLLADPTNGGGANPTGGGAPAFAPEQDASLPPDIALAYAHALHQKPPPSSQPQPQDFEQRWSAWGSAFGGANRTEGDAAVGSNNVTASDFGFAAGMTYHVTPGTDYGFALAGGGTNWNLAQNLGSGRSNSFQAGVYGTTHFGPAYLSGALAFANHWFSTNRIAVGDNLTAKFQGQSYAARGEAGYRYGVPVTGYIVGVTPYAALQVQDFHTPGYSETDLGGGGFGLTYNAVNATDARSELGARFDNLTVWDGMPLVLRGRLAWAHDWVNNPSLGAVFQALPGSNFTVNGAAPPKNSALTTAGAELHLTANWTAMAKFDGEFGSGSQTYAGTGTLKYSW